MSHRKDKGRISKTKEISKIPEQSLDNSESIVLFR